MKERKLLLTHYKHKEAAFLLQNDRLIQIMIESDSAYRIGDIYVGRVKNMVSAMKAAFVELAPGTVGFLPLSNGKPCRMLNRLSSANTEKCSDCAQLKCGDEILVQVSKEALKTKEVTLTTEISFSGKYLVLIPFGHGIHYSNKLDVDMKTALRGKISETIEAYFDSVENFLQGYGMIVRTNAAQAKLSDISEELEELLAKTRQVLGIADKRTVYSCLSKAENFFERIIKNHYQPENTEIITDEKEIFDLVLNQVHDYSASKNSAHYNSDTGNSVRLYEDTRISMYSLYGLEEKINEALSKKVWLKSGGYLIIEPTEALTVIDVNSGKSCATKGKASQIQFHAKINEEAAVEILRQLRLRNLSGIIIVDFLKTDDECSKALIQKLKSMARFDPVETMIIGTTALGLVEITRKKTEAPLHEKI